MMCNKPMVFFHVLAFSLLAALPPAKEADLVPSGLVEPCDVTKAKRFVSWPLILDVQLVDRANNQLAIVYRDYRISFVSAGHQVVSTPIGGKEEVVALKILEIYASTHPNEEHYKLDGVDHMIKTLKRRCETKQDPPYGT